MVNVFSEMSYKFMCMPVFWGWEEGKEVFLTAH